MPLESADPVTIGTIAKHRLSILAGTGQEVTIWRDRTAVQLMFEISSSANSKLRTALITCSLDRLLVVSGHGKPTDSVAASLRPFSPYSGLGSRSYL